MFPTFNLMPSCPNCGDEVAPDATICPACDFNLTIPIEEEQIETDENDVWHFWQWAMAFGVAFASAITMTKMSMGSYKELPPKLLYTFIGLETLLGCLLLRTFLLSSNSVGGVIVKIIVIFALGMVLYGLSTCTNVMTTRWGFG